MTIEPIIKLEDVWKIYQLGKISLEVLRGVSLEINPGAFVTLMGPSGSGKSTLLHIIGCLDVPTKGKVFLGGQDISRMSEDDLAKIRGQKIGFIFQQFNLFSTLNSLENITLPMVFQGVSEQRRIERAKELLSWVGLEDRIFHKPPELSGGEQQRVAVARALANDPEIIVADEPTGNLDSATGKTIMQILTDFHKNKKKTIVVVTHDPLIAEYSEDTINIKDGLIVKNHMQTRQVLWKT